MIEHQLWQLIRNDATIRSFIGNRIFPGRAPRGQTFPYLTYFRLTSERYPTLSGTNSLARARIQFDAWSDSYDQARRLAERLRLCMDGHESGDFAITFGIYGVFLKDEFEDYQPPKSGRETGIYRVGQDYEIFFKEDISN